MHNCTRSYIHVYILKICYILSWFGEQQNCRCTRNDRKLQTMIAQREHMHWPTRTSGLYKLLHSKRTTRAIWAKLHDSYDAAPALYANTHTRKSTYSLHQYDEKMRTENFQLLLQHATACKRHVVQITTYPTQYARAYTYILTESSLVVKFVA